MSEANTQYKHGVRMRAGRRGRGEREGGELGREDEERALD